MFDIGQETYTETDGTIHERSFLVMKGQRVDDSWAIRHRGDELISAGVYNAESALPILQLPISQMGVVFETLSLPLQSEVHDGIDSCKFRAEDKSILAQFNVEFEWEKWARAYSMSDVAESLKKHLEDEPSGFRYFVDDEDDFLNGFGIKYTIVKSEDSFGLVLSQLEPKIKSIMAAVEDRLLLESDSKSLVTMFNFPLRIRTVCEQYLIYFIQFLQDLGIEASGSISHEAGQVLFSVTPSDEQEGLERIREALTLYMKLPSHPIEALDSGTDMAVQQLKANVAFLSGQLMLAQAIVQAKDATIEALQLSNFQYRQASGGTMISSNQQKDSEPLIPGVVTVVPVDVKGLTINLPELLRRLKRRFSH